MKIIYLCSKMMKASYIKSITFVAIVLILLLQTLWSVNVYSLMQKQLFQQITDVFNMSVNKELMDRWALVVDSTSNDVIGVVEDDYEKGIFVGPELIYQEFLIKRGSPISLHTLDVIFHTETVKQNIYVPFIINRLNPQTGEVLETTSKNNSGKLRGALASTIIPIRLDDSEGVQVLLISPYRRVFRNMVFVLLLSAVILLFVAYVFFSLVQSFFKEHKIRRLQSDFSHALIHDMATPLQTIFQIHVLLGNEKYVTNIEKRNKGLEVAQQQIINLQALADRILTVARAEQLQLVPVLEVMNINEMIHELIDKFLLQGKKEIIFTANFVPENIYVSADRTMLTNAVSNLIDNCVKYSGQTVHIIIECVLKENGLYISIKDDGYGISDKDQRIIFAKFERGPAVKRQEAKGFGLGLTYVKSVAEAHRGTVNLHSKQGEGTVFELFIPFK